jgi:polyisoprenoid-binding protein YceI
MRSRLLLAATLLAASSSLAFAQVAPAGTPAPADPNTWNIDPNHTAAQFAVRHLLVSTVRGQFDKLSGSVIYDGRDINTLRVNVVIDAASVNTRVERRDNDLRSANFFEVATYPTITFVSKRVESAGAGKFKLVGDLTMHGVTKEVVLDVEGPTAVLKQANGNQRVGASATGKINRRDFGLQFNAVVEGAPVVGDEITLTIDIEAVKRGG